MRTRTVSSGVALLLSAVACSIFSQDNDSLAYQHLRMQVRSLSPTDPALLTADILAESGLYSEAANLLREHPLADRAASPSTPRPAPVRWRIGSGVDIFRLQDLDTVTMTAEQARDYRRLTETPLSGWVRAHATLTPAGGFVEEICPQGYVSQRSGRLETSARLRLLDGWVRMEPSLRAEKWFRSDGSSTSALEPGSRHPRDMGGLALRLTNGSPPARTETVPWTTPLSIDWEHYRSESPGYESRVVWRFDPSFELRSAHSPRYARLTLGIGYDDYYRGSADTLDAVRATVNLGGGVRHGPFNATAGALWIGEHTAKLAIPGSLNRTEATTRLEYRLSPRLAPTLRLRGIHEFEVRSANPVQTGDTANTYNGSELSAEAGIDIDLTQHFDLTPVLLVERRTSGTRNHLPVWDARMVMEPGVRLSWHFLWGDGAVSAAYRDENSDALNTPTRDDNRGVRLGTEAVVNPIEALSLSLFADYQYRTYPAPDARGRVSENISVSASATVRM